MFDELAVALYRSVETKGFTMILRQDFLEPPEVEADPRVKDFYCCALWSLSREHLPGGPAHEFAGVGGDIAGWDQ